MSTDTIRGPAALGTRTRLPAIRLAITGAPGTGKTTLATALSLASGLPHAGLAPESSVVTSGRRLAETVELPVRMFERRVSAEAIAESGFVSDGSVLNDWARAESVRRGRSLLSWLTNPRDIPNRIFEQRFLAAHGAIVARRAAATYDAFIHLRLDAATLVGADAAQRTLIDRILLETLHASTVPYFVFGGSLEDVVTHLTRLYRLPELVPAAQAVAAASKAP
ncbi:AAA family ATPase [Nocardia brasiliensis]|uniref:AAA family ATPase n=1 Tax=Nocardia brasiliensis TaxID=37326 RepID=A0A6G9XZI8_NOCBR|nr:AAA family ATPase [Nocardia brasiliensis]QIS06270.1 AAA family ATPase [Nocardia brasiliensis]